MRKHVLFLLLTVLSTFAYSQVDSKYLQGAVPEENDKVIFTRTFVPSKPISSQQLYQVMSEWADTNYKPSEKFPLERVLYSDSESKSIFCQGYQMLVFKSTALSVDRAKMSYQLVLHIDGTTCKAMIRNIKYEYTDPAAKGEAYTAENTIADKVALNKNKLNRHYDKFRIFTIDAVNEIFDSIDIYLNGKKATDGAITAQEINIEPVAETIQIAIQEPTTEEIPDPLMYGYRKIEPDKIPGNYIKLLNEWTLITSGTNDKTNVMTASWGGLGVFWGKPVAFCFLGATRYSVNTMDAGDTYTISFYTEAYKENMKYCGSNSGRDTDKIKGSGLTPIKTPSGATAFSEAWMILECRKIIAQPLSKEAVYNKESFEQWLKNDLHKMYIGEILNVWIK